MGETVDLKRRRFLAGSLHQRKTALRPPWLNENALGCSGCGACAEACPNRLIVLAHGKPEISFTSNACTFCGACAKACPEQLFDEDRQAFAHVATIGGGCLTYRGVVCQSCRDACPEAAIRFMPRRGGPFLPDIRAADCSGCGACVAACPTSAVQMAALAESPHA